MVELTITYLLIAACQSYYLLCFIGTNRSQLFSHHGWTASQVSVERDAWDEVRLRAAWQWRLGVREDFRKQHLSTNESRIHHHPSITHP